MRTRLPSRLTDQYSGNMSTTSTSFPHSLRELSDRDLWARFSALGRDAREARQRFLVLLPEVRQRRLHRKRSFPSLVACAQQLGGVSAATVERILALHKRLRPHPELWALVEAGEVGWSVVDRVPAKLLSRDPKAWARNFLSLSKRDIETLVREARSRQAPAFEDSSSSRSDEVRPMGGAARESMSPSNPRPGAINSTGASKRSMSISLHLSRTEQEQLRLLLHQHERDTGEAISISEFVTNLVRKHALEGAESPTEDPDREQFRKAVASAEKAKGARVPVTVERYIRARARNLCERAGCRNPGVHVHHLFGRKGDRPHHPAKLGLLCLSCHDLLHLGRIENPTDPPWHWRVSDPTAPPNSKPRDRMFQEHRRRRRKRRRGGG